MKPLEYKIYFVPVDMIPDDKLFDEMEDEEVMELAEEEGNIYSLAGFMDELNHDHLNSDAYWFRAILS